MAKKLDVRQLNNLLTGKTLAAEIPASSDDWRAFVVIHAYKSGGGDPSKFLNAADQADLLFAFTKYEVERQHLWDDDVDYYIHNVIRRRDIASIEALEWALADYLDDFAALDLSWRVRHPF
jgi:hypothetical protein